MHRLKRNMTFVNESGNAVGSHYHDSRHNFKSQSELWTIVMILPDLEHSHGVAIMLIAETFLTLN